MVSDDEAREIMRELLTLISGYMVPKLAREIGEGTQQDAAGFRAEAALIN